MKRLILVALMVLVGMVGGFGMSSVAAESPWASIQQQLQLIQQSLDSLQSAVNQMPPSWSKKLRCDTTDCPRFELVLDDAAVLDKETGLVWQREPANTAYTWDAAFNYCHTELNLGGRKGWHLPTIEQLSSLVDTSSTGSVILPDGHPFINVQPVPYWSATTMMFENNPHLAWLVHFNDGGVSVGVKSHPQNRSALCVRGGQTYDDFVVR